MTVSIGDLAPAIDLPAHDGSRWRLGDHLGRPVILIFHRHLACLPCQEHVIAVRDRLDELGDTDVVVIAFSAPEYVAAYQRDRLAPLDVLVDRERVTYRAYGLGRGSLWKVWGPKVWLAYIRLLRKGRRFQRPTDDTFQLGGDFVVGRDGRVVFSFASSDADDRPSVDELIDAVHQA